jgi:hypothetical protein
MTIRFTILSRLPADQRGALEKLLFFNEQQSQFHHRIVESIASFGNPQIVDDDGSLRIRLSGRHDAQALFAVADAQSMVPVGAAIYVRDLMERFVVAHIAVDEEYSARGRFAGEHLFFHLLQAVRGAANVTAGIRYVDFCYADRKMGRMHVRKPQRPDAGADAPQSRVAAAR